MLNSEIQPITQILDARGNDWSWAYVVFREIPGFKGYMADTEGRIWSRYVPRKSRLGDTWRQIRPGKNQDGYLSVNLYYETNKSKSFHVSALVARTFLGERPAGMEVCHFPSPERSDNRLANLRYGTRQENIDHQIVHGTRHYGSKTNAAKLHESDLPTIAKWHHEGLTNTEIARRFKVDVSTITRILNRQQWAHVELPLPDAESTMARLSNPRRGCRNRQTKLNMELILAIRADYNANPVRGIQRQLMRKYGLTQPTISDIVRNKVWKT